MHMRDRKIAIMTLLSIMTHNDDDMSAAALKDILDPTHDLEVSKARPLALH
jgi:hypothetical protein